MILYSRLHSASRHALTRLRLRLPPAHSITIEPPWLLTSFMAASGLAPQVIPTLSSWYINQRLLSLAPRGRACPCPADGMTPETIISTLSTAQSPPTRSCSRLTFSPVSPTLSPSQSRRAEAPRPISPARLSTISAGCSPCKIRPTGASMPN